MSDRDNITLPREVVEDVLYALVSEQNHGGDDCYADSITALRTALAAEQPKPEPVAWMFVNLDGECEQIEYGTPPTDDDSITPLYTALAAEQPKQEHPGYVIGSHWLETAYSRICAGEAEADVLRDCGWERVDQALRRDAERYRWLRERAWFQFEFEGRYGDSGETVQELDAAIDAAMEASTAPASAAADASTAPEDKP